LCLFAPLSYCLLVLGIKPRPGRRFLRERIPTSERNIRARYVRYFNFLPVPDNSSSDDAHSGSPSFASELANHDPQPSISPSLSPSPVVQCTLLADFDMFDDQDIGAPGTHPHSHHVSYPHPYVYTHSGPCPHSSLHKRIGFGFINILDLLSVLGVIAFAACASGIAALFRRRHRHGRYDYYDDDYEKKSPIESLDSDDEYHNHTHRHNRFNSLNHPHTHPASAYPYSGQGYHHLPSSGDAYQSEEVMRYIDSKLR